MPTGYTAYIEDGNISTGKDFLTLCCRAFGVCIDMKDDLLSVPIPEEFVPDMYYKKRYDDALLALEKAKSITESEAVEIMKSEKKGREESIKSYIEKEEKQKEAYSKIRTEIEAWIPPTSEHINLKNFALEQIDISMPGLSSYYNEELAKNQIEVSPQEYIKNQITLKENSVKRAKESYDAEIKRTDEKNKWLKLFRDSFK